ncbi:hypothetical protein DRH29_01720 [candidate division Kazan bacterium]|uniref:Mannosyl-glycoprotein endo-beta-N-acetylglucosamidase-like domain-containing protein n=1 Tax=candidate division Kazan bacterium TaxID=2202143 RepID=A0A420ZDC4_UNCK3|nr:MAG: hypothetical protein DRH29_01720 [candidate division Kazan bacterium]
MNSLVGAIFALLAYIAVGGPVGYDLDPLTSQLQTFLSDKGSPIPAVEVTKYDNWRTIIAISAAESSYGKHMAGNFNAWGIKDYRKGSDNFGKTRNFNSWSESIKYTSELLYKYDPQDGEPTPWGMVRTWKYVEPLHPWVNNVSYALYDIECNVSVA